MNKKTIAVLLMAAATVLTACGTDKKEPTKENFQAALKTFAEGKETRECVGSLKFPIEQNGNVSVTTFLVKQGWVKEASEKVVLGARYKVYDLTDAGKGELKQNQSGSYSVCFGKMEIGEVQNWTEPADMYGTKVSKVEFATNFKLNEKPWAKEFVETWPGLSHSVAQMTKKTSVEIPMELKNDGWHVMAK